MTNQPGESRRVPPTAGPQPDTPTGYVAAVCGYVIGVVVPLGIAVGAAVWFDSAYPAPSGVNCWHDWITYCQWGWLFNLLPVLAYVLAILGFGPLGSLIALRISGQPGGSGTAMWALALSPVHVVDLVAGSGGLVAFAIVSVFGSIAVGLLARLIWSQRQQDHAAMNAPPAAP